MNSFMTTVTLTDKLSNSLDNTVINYFDSFADTFNLDFDECCKLETPKHTKRTMTMRNNPWTTPAIITSIC